MNELDLVLLHRCARASSAFFFLEGQCAFIVWEIFNEEVLVGAGHQPAPITSVPFTHSARHFSQLNRPLKYSDRGFCDGLVQGGSRKKFIKYYHLEEGEGVTRFPYFADTHRNDQKESTLQSNPTAPPARHRPPCPVMRSATAASKALRLVKANEAGVPTEVVTVGARLLHLTGLKGHVVDVDALHLAAQMGSLLCRQGKALSPHDRCQLVAVVVDILPTYLRVSDTVRDVLGEAMAGRMFTECKGRGSSSEMMGLRESWSPAKEVSH